jgi:hypothetical protein
MSKRKQGRGKPGQSEPFNILRDFNERNMFTMVGLTASLKYIVGSFVVMVTSGYTQLALVNAALVFNEIPVIPDIPVSDDIQLYISTLNERGRAFAGSPAQVGLWENGLERSVSLFASNQLYPMDFDITNEVSDDEVTAIINTSLNLDLLGGNRLMLGDDQKAWDATIAQVSYILATAQHESDFFNTLREYGGPGYLSYLDGVNGNRWYDTHGDNEFGEPDYVTYSGTGLIQVTGRNNFHTVGKKLKAEGIIDDDMYFVNNPEELQKPEWAAIALVMGMRDGWYTELSLRDFIGTESDMINARRIVNGDVNHIPDGAAVTNGELIANYANGYRPTVEKRYRAALGKKLN